MAGALRLDRLPALLRADAVSVQALRFVVAGVCNAAFGFGVFALATWLGASALTALVVSTAAGVAFNLQTSRRLVFKTQGGDVARFVGLYLGLLLANWAALSLLRRLGLPQIAAQALLLAPFAALSFAGQRALVFTTAERRAPRALRQPWSARPWSRRLRDLALGRDIAPPADPRVWLFVVGLGGADAAFLLGMSASPWLGLAACGLAACALVTLLGSPLRARWRWSADGVALWAAAAALALALCLLGGEGRLFYANSDWQIRDAVLADLSTRPWPVQYSEDGAAFVLRAPLGMYLTPALAGRAFGWRAAQPALLIQNAALMTGVLAVFMSGARRWRGRLAIAAVFVAFSGLDLVGEVLLGRFTQPAPWDRLFPSLETWAGGLQYSSLVTDLFWAPNHAIPAWIMAATYLLWRRGQASIAAVAAVAGLSVLWSPLAVMGAAPFIAAGALGAWRRSRFAVSDGAKLLALGVALLPIARYVTLDGGDVVHGLNNSTPAFKHGFAPFELLEVAPLLYLAAQARGLWDDDDRRDAYLCAVVLVLAPFYRIGASNDFMMRATIFPITLLAMMTARGLLARSGPDRLRRLAIPLVVLAIGAATPAAEIIRALVEPANPSQPTDLFTAWRQPASRGSPKTAYVVPAAAYAGQAWGLKPVGAARSGRP